MKRRLVMIVVCGLYALAALGCFLSTQYGFRSEAQAMKRINSFTKQVNYGFNDPGKIYEYLTQEYRDRISKQDFITAFEKERTYPYLTPFFINFTSLEMEKGNYTGLATFSQAARLPGMIYEMPVVYENGNYFFFMEEYAGFPDGSYLKKFDSIPKYLTEGWH